MHTLQRWKQIKEDVYQDKPANQDRILRCTVCHFFPDRVVAASGAQPLDGTIIICTFCCSARAQHLHKRASGQLKIIDTDLIGAARRRMLTAHVQIIQEWIDLAYVCKTIGDTRRAGTGNSVKDCSVRVYSLCTSTQWRSRYYTVIGEYTMPKP